MFSPHSSVGVVGGRKRGRRRAAANQQGGFWDPVGQNPPGGPGHHQQDGASRVDGCAENTETNAEPIVGIIRARAANWNVFNFPFIFAKTELSVWKVSVNVTFSSLAYWILSWI